jgi:uncharacterized membrane protein
MLIATGNARPAYFHTHEASMAILCALILGFVAGLRSMLAPAAISWAAGSGILNVDRTPLAFMGYRYTPIIFTVLALGELIADKLPFTPSRKSPPAFGARIVSGALTGATIGAAVHSLALLMILGAVGAVMGTLAGAGVRARLAALFHRDLPAALIEDVFAILLACLSVRGLK